MLGLRSFWKLFTEEIDTLDNWESYFESRYPLVGNITKWKPGTQYEVIQLGWKEVLCHLVLYERIRGKKMIDIYWRFWEALHKFDVK